MALTSRYHAPRRGPLRRAAGGAQARRIAAVLVAGAVLAGLLATAGCSTAKRREEPSNIVGALRFRGEETREHFLHNYRSGNLYHEFRPVMVADAIFQDERYRALFLDTLRQRYLLAEDDVAPMVREQQENFDSYFEFLVFLYGGSNVPIRLNAPDSNWRLLMRDDDGDVIAPVSMQGIKVDSATYRYIGNYFAGLDRWTQAYVVRFPKLEKTLTGEKPGAGPVELLVTGLEGTITMRWEEPGMFYRSEAGIQLAGMESDAAARPSPRPDDSRAPADAAPAPERADADAANAGR